MVLLILFIVVVVFVRVVIVVFGYMLLGNNFVIDVGLENGFVFFVFKFSCDINLI